MAHRLSGPVFVIDAAASLPLTITSAVIGIRAIRWVSKAAVAGDDVLVTDGNDLDLWESCAAGANTVEDTPLGILVSGLKVPTLDSGKLYIYLM